MTTNAEQTAPGSTTPGEIPPYPLARAARCPFDPPPAHREWQQEVAPKRVRLWNGETAWMITRYDDIRTLLTDSRVSADSRHSLFPRLSPGQSTLTPDEASFARMDDPEHDRQRKMLTGAFTVRRAEAMSPQIERLTDDLLDAMVAGGQPADLVSEFSLPLPSLVIAVLLGVPYEDHASFQTWSNDQINMALPAEQARASRQKFTAYMGDLVDRKQREPGDDLTSRLVTERLNTGEITRKQLVNNLCTLLLAGHETTANMIALSTLTLLRNPDQLSRLRDTDDRAVWANAVEEMLRYLTIAENAVVRLMQEDITVGGQLIRTGEGLLMGLPAGNRDTAFLAEEPDTVDIGHDTRGHLAFGYGVHQCIGQNLARVELRIAMRALLRKLPGLRLAVPFEEVPFRQKMSVYGVTSLPIAW
ncbi:cytochrome P450 [Streptomyces sp. NPDC002143]